MSEKSKTKAQKKKAAPPDEKVARRRRPDALARAQAEVDGAAPTGRCAATEEAVNAIHVESPDDVRDWAQEFEGDASSHPADAPPGHVEASATTGFVEATEARVAPPGPLVHPPGVSGTRGMVMADLSARERRALSAIASDWHRQPCQIDAFEAGKVALPSALRAPQDARRLIDLGLVVERKAHFLTPHGARVAASGGITVTRPIVQDSAPVKAAS